MGVKLLPDAPADPVASYSHADGNIASITPLQLRDLGNSPTVVEVIYTDTTVIPWRDASAYAELPGAGETLPYRLSQVRLPGIHRYSQARREAIERLNKLTLQDLITTVEVFDEGIKAEIGDVIEVTHPIGITDKKFRIVSPENPSPGRWVLQLAEYDPAAYSDVVETVPTYANSGALISNGTGGADGADGTSVAEITVFRRLSAPATPTGGTFSFATAELTVVPTDWYVNIADIPAGADPIHAARGVASTATPGGSDTPTWAESAQVFADGADATALNLQVSATQFIFNTLGAPQPAAQTITVDAFTVNFSEAVAFTIELYDASGTLIDETPALGGTGNTGRTLPIAQFFDAAYADIIAETTSPAFSVRTRITRTITTAAASGVTSFSLAVFAVAVGGSDARSDIRLNTDGTIDRRRNNGTWEYRANWYSPTTADIGDSFRVIASKTGDDLVTGTLGSYEVLDTARVWGLETDTIASSQTKSAALEFTLVELADTTPLAMGATQLDVTKEP